jgi:radical SAM superfamily enzyme YgiQ (UPF0313 family)
MVGGPHVTANPDGVMSEEWVDLACRGEGDLMLPDVVNRLAQGLSLTGTPNLLHRRDGAVVREPLGMFVEDLDSLPFEDRDIFDFSSIIASRAGWAEVIVTRGCPYPCSYCFNKPMLDDYSAEVQGGFNRKQYVRRRSVASTMTMLNDLTACYPEIRGITFVDDILAIDPEWFGEFARRYRDEVGLPYACTSHPLLFNRRLAEQLQYSGCKVVKMGLESGSADIRKKILQRNISDEYLIEVFGIAHEFGLKTQAFNMIGLPGETVEQMMATVHLNARIKPYIVWVSTFIPYPGTSLYLECRKQGLIDDDKLHAIGSYRGDSPLIEEAVPALPFMKLRQLFRWHLNVALHNEARPVYEEQIRDLLTYPADAWLDGSVEREFLQRDAEIDQYLRDRDISHYVSKKYINIFWGKEYGYDLT